MKDPDLRTFMNTVVMEEIVPGVRLPREEVLAFANSVFVGLSIPISLKDAVFQLVRGIKCHQGRKGEGQQMWEPAGCVVIVTQRRKDTRFPF